MMLTSTFFIKEPNTPTFAAWHQDLTYYGLEPAEEVTVWVALTDANHAVGCMGVLPFDGAPRQMRHAANVVENSVNRAAQVVMEAFDESHVVTMEVKVGQFSIHHGLCPHRSGPNTASHRRIGLGLDYIPGHVRSIGAFQTAAMPVRGEDHWGHFELVTPPKTELDTDALATREGRWRPIERHIENRRRYTCADLHNLLACVDRMGRRHQCRSNNKGIMPWHCGKLKNGAARETLPVI